MLCRVLSRAYLADDICVMQTSTSLQFFALFSQLSCFSELNCSSLWQYGSA